MYRQTLLFAEIIIFYFNFFVIDFCESKMSLWPNETMRGITVTLLVIEP